VRSTTGCSPLADAARDGGPAMPALWWRPSPAMDACARYDTPLHDTPLPGMPSRGATHALGTPDEKPAGPGRRFLGRLIDGVAGFGVGDRPGHGSASGGLCTRSRRTHRLTARFACSNSRIVRITAHKPWRSAFGQRPAAFLCEARLGLALVAGEYEVGATALWGRTLGNLVTGTGVVLTADGRPGRRVAATMGGPPMGGRDGGWRRSSGHPGLGGGLECGAHPIVSAALPEPALQASRESLDTPVWSFRRPGC